MTFNRNDKVRMKRHLLPKVHYATAVNTLSGVGTVEKCFAGAVHVSYPDGSLYALVIDAVELAYDDGPADFLLDAGIAS